MFADDVFREKFHPMEDSKQVANTSSVAFICTVSTKLIIVGFVLFLGSIT